MSASDHGLGSPYRAPQPISSLAGLPEDAPPILCTVISTEEEFDWSVAFDPGATDVGAAKHIGRAQEMFDGCGVRPVYVVDYPIAASPNAYPYFREILESGRCEIGAHLHPWVTPPVDEQIGLHNSFPGNLPRELESRKLTSLFDTIERNLGRRPTSYQAGRYGFGERTAELLREGGIEVDFSASAAFDFSFEGGPDFSQLTSESVWGGPDGRLLCVPVSGAFLGKLGRLSPGAHRVSTALSWAKVPGVLSRLGLLDRLRLSPEGYTLEDLRRLTHHLYAQGVRVFVFSFHSPSVQPGCTPYVSDQRELGTFLDKCRAYYSFFFEELGGRSMTGHELYTHLRAPEAASAT